MAIDLKFHAGEPSGFGAVIFSRVIPSDLQVKATTLDELLEVLARHQVFREAEDEVRMRLCIDEVLVNAIVHGNESAPDKRVTITAYLSDDRVGVLVEDEGKGFTPKDVPDPDDPESLLLEGGRGVLIITSFMDEVKYYGNGSRVLMVRRIGANAPPAPSA